MKIASEKVVRVLNELLSNELTANHQYLVHSRMLKHWGYEKIAERIKEESDEELTHADRLIERILLMDGHPELKTHPLSLGKDLRSVFEKDYSLECSVADALRNGVTVCEDEHDYVTADLLVELLRDTEEEHAYWLEKQLKLMDAMGIQNYAQISAV